jgi:hypothetical protein
VHLTERLTGVSRRGDIGTEASAEPRQARRPCGLVVAGVEPNNRRQDVYRDRHPPR